MGGPSDATLYERSVQTPGTAAGIEPMSSTPEQFAAFIRSENARFAKVIRDAGIKPE